MKQKQKNISDLDSTFEEQNVVEGSTTFNKTIHIFIHKKGGAGKTMLCSKVGEGLILKGYDPLVFDLEPQNDGHKISKYKTFRIIPIDMFGEDMEVNPTAYDKLYSGLIQEQQPSLIDVGGPAFNSFVSYARDMDMVCGLQEAGYQVICHVIISAGQNGVVDTLGTLQTLHENFPTLQFYLWQNEFYATKKISDQPDLSFIGEPTLEFPQGESIFKNRLLLSDSFAEVWIGKSKLPKPTTNLEDAYKLAVGNNHLSIDLYSNEAQEKFQISPFKVTRVKKWSEAFFNGLNDLESSLLSTK